MKDVLNKIVKYIKDHKFMFILNIVIFILTVFIQSLYSLKINELFVYILLVLYTVVPTFMFVKKNKVNSKEILISIVEIYLLFILFLNKCTMIDLYGITDKSYGAPAMVDALFVTFVITFIQYLTIKVASKKIKK